jgi:hypothetical protein
MSSPSSNSDRAERPATPGARTIPCPGPDRGRGPAGWRGPGARLYVLAGHLLVATAGMFTAATAGSMIAARMQSPQSRWLIMNTGCWSAAPWAYNDVKAPNGIVADRASGMSSLLNFVWCNEYSGAHTPIFSQFGKSDFLEKHLFWIDRAASTPGVEAIIYTNAPGEFGSFLESGPTLVLIPTLERIRQMYPEAAPDVDIYLRCLYDSEGYQRALAECGADWRDRVDLETGTLRPRGIHHSLKQWMDDQTQFMSKIRECVTTTLIALPAWGRKDPQRDRRSPNSAKIVELLDQCAARYLDPDNQRGLKRPMKKEVFWSAVGGDEVWTAFANIVAKICKARGIKLVFYAPPHVNLTDPGSRETYEREYVDLVRKTFSGFSHVFVLDHVRGQTLCQSDSLWDYFPTDERPAPGLAYNSGEIPNIIGRLKSARFIISTLLETGLLTDGGTTPRHLGSSWPGEQFLPTRSLVLDFLPESEQRIVTLYIETEDARNRSSKAATHSQPPELPQSPSPSPEPSG